MSSNILQKNVNTINVKNYKIDKNLSNDKILFKFEYDSNDLFESKGKLILTFTFSFNVATIEIYDFNSNLLNKVVGYQNIIYIWNTELNNFYIKVTDENGKIYERKITLKDCLNLKTSNIAFLPFNYNGKNIIESILKLNCLKHNKILIKYMVNFPECCQEMTDTCPDNLGTIYFYDYEKLSTQNSYLKVDWFTWENFSTSAIIKNKLNKFVISKDKMKFGTRFKCAFSMINKSKNRCELILSPLEHYQFVDNLLNLIDSINKQYQINNQVYRFLFNNPLIKSNDLIIEVSSSE